MVRGDPRKPHLNFHKTFSKIRWTTPLSLTRVTTVMPNHTANNFTITGPKDTIMAFIERAKDKNPDELEPQALSFNSFLPMPSELRHTTSPTRIQTQEEIDKAWADWNKRKEAGTLAHHEKDKPWGLGLTQEQYDDLITKHGCANWYDWCVNNWGTKWDCYEVRDWSINEVEVGRMSATIYYETAWSPVTQFWLKVSEMYSDCEFFHEYADEGGEFLGHETIQGGSLMHEEEFDWNSDDGIELREGLGRYWPDEDEENVDEARVNE